MPTRCRPGPIRGGGWKSSFLRYLVGYEPWDALELLLSLDLDEPDCRPFALLRADDRAGAVHAILAARARRPDLVRAVSTEEAEIAAALDDDVEVPESLISAASPGPSQS